MSAKVKQQTTDSTSETERPQPGASFNAPPYHRKIVLRRTGKKTMRFAGDECVNVTGYSTAHSHWYEISIFTRVVGGYVACIRHFYKSDAQRDRFIAERFDTAEGAIGFLEDYRADAELHVTFDPASPDVSAAEIALCAAGLRTRQASYKAAYETVLGDALHALINTLETPTAA